MIAHRVAQGEFVDRFPLQPLLLGEENRLGRRAQDLILVPEARRSSRDNGVHQSVRFRRDLILLQDKAESELEEFRKGFAWSITASRDSRNVFDATACAIKL